MQDFYCPDHGYLCATLPSATVTCGARVGLKKKRCNKRGVSHAKYKETARD